MSINEETAGVEVLIPMLLFVPSSRNMLSFRSDSILKLRASPASLKVAAALTFRIPKPAELNVKVFDPDNTLVVEYTATFAPVEDPVSGVTGEEAAVSLPSSSTVILAYV